MVGGKLRIRAAKNGDVDAKVVRLTPNDFFICLSNTQVLFVYGREYMLLS